MKKIDFRKIKEFLERALIAIAQRVFLTCVFLAVLALIIGGISFYKYSILAQKVKPGDFKYFQLEEEVYQEVLKVWWNKEQKFKEADTKEYPDPFRRGAAEPEEVD